MSIAMTMGESSYTAIWYLTRSLSQDEASHEDPSVAAKPWQLDASVCRVMWSNDKNVGGKKKDFFYEMI